MINDYNPKEIEGKWQKFWLESEVYKTEENSPKPKQYILDMFPYPSGAGLHVGHPRGYIGSDVLARMRRMQGYNVLHPMGFDAFGLPAEQYAIQTGEHPSIVTEKAIATYKKQLEIIGFSYDWSREVRTMDPAFYKWTQWIFLQLFDSYYDEQENKAKPISELISKFEKEDSVWTGKSEKEKQEVLMNYRLAYEGYSEVNWCPELGTVLANDEVLDGPDGTLVSERGGFTVEKKNMRQWFLRITSYADRLLSGLNTIDWPSHIKEIQRNWIGKSEGAEISFKIKKVEPDGDMPVLVDHKNPPQEGKPTVARRNIHGIVYSKERDAYLTFVWKKLPWTTIIVGGVDEGENLVEAARREITEETGYTDLQFKGILGGPVESHYYAAHKEENRAAITSAVYFTLNSEHQVVVAEEERIHNDVVWTPAAEFLPEKLAHAEISLWLERIAELEKAPSVDVFTTRPDTLFGATYVTLAPEHPLLQTLKGDTKNWNEISAYIELAKNKSEADRKDAKDKTGIEIKGIKAVNPANGEEVPVWVSDYVLANYGTGAVMAVPAHDERDFEFAKKFGLPIKLVIAEQINIQTTDSSLSWLNASDLQEDLILSKDQEKEIILKNETYQTISKKGALIWPGLLISSGQFTGKRSWLIKENLVNFVGGKMVTKYKMRDAIFARQRYWGEPIPLMHQKEKIPYFIDPDFPPKSEFGVPVERNNVSVVLTDPKQKKVLVLKWKKYPWVSFIGGGIEQGEDVVECAEREVKEETGYMSIRFIKKFDQTIHVESSADHKKQNRYAKICMLHFEIVNDQRTELSDVESAQHEAVWLDVNEVEKTITGPEAHAIWEIFQYEKVSRCDKWIEVNSGIVTQLSEKDLPLELPKVDSYKPTGTGESPLAGVPEWVEKGYETNTMPGWAGSSWYFLRYMDSKNSDAFASPETIDYWQNVDVYVGGSEHSTGHLLYSRFWHKFLHDRGFVPTEEPFKVLKNQGFIIASDGRKMSKRWGNVVNPDEMVERFGADAFRLYEAFIGPFDQYTSWNTDGVVGTRRFLERVWRAKEKIGTENKEIDIVVNKTIKKISEDIENFRFNTSVSSMMILVNKMEEVESFGESNYKDFLKILAPFAPHMTEELWQVLGEKGSIHLSEWPTFDASKFKDEKVKIAIQINGKVRDEVEIAPDATEEEAENLALERQIVKDFVHEQKIKKFIYVPGKIINIVL